MKKSAGIFLLAVLLPSLVLGWLALRSAEEQQIILERRTAGLYQRETENVAAAARTIIDEERRAFAESVRKLLADQRAEKLAPDFASTLARVWPRKAVGFALASDGRMLSPSLRRAADNPAWGAFLTKNGEFLAGKEPATVYPVAVEELNRPEQMRNKLKGRANEGYYNVQKAAPSPPAPATATMATAASAQAVEKEANSRLRADRTLRQSDPTYANAGQTRAQSETLPQARGYAAPGNAADKDSAKFAARAAQKAESSELKKTAQVGQEFAKTAALDEPDPVQRADNTLRNVSPQLQNDTDNKASVSQLFSETTQFLALCSSGEEGMVTRFVEDRLEMIFWMKPAQAPGIIFGCLIEADTFRDRWPAAMPEAASSSHEFVLALLDDKARPVLTEPAGSPTRDWKRPFVASEIGEALPHWEAALYLMHPEQLKDSALAVRRTLLLLIAGSLGAIACGGWLVVADARRQIALAQQKTDFVSNVSHELKTPLTSIRMFAELMQGGTTPAPKQNQYLKIIVVEAERLTRLINNVLDFAKLERRQMQLEKRPLELHGLIERVWSNHAVHLEECGFEARWKAAPPPYPVTADQDAITQILVNLLSNAEKYAGECKEVELHTSIDDDCVRISVLDRGPGVARGHERKIFQAFYRANDSLSNPVQGSGLGLTLAQHLADEHGGRIIYQARSGGGSEFTLVLPLTRPL